MGLYNEKGQHIPELETLEHIADWCNTPFPFSKNDGWGRFGLLGVIGDIALLTNPGACIVEIGTGESSIYLTELARRHKRQIFYCDFAWGKIANPLTVKGYLHEDTFVVRDTQKEVPQEAYSHQAIAYQGTSDDFFKLFKIPPIGLAFIDGEHHYEYVRRDFDNIYERLVSDGYIFLHDTSPPDESYVLNDYCADAYKVRQELEIADDIDVFTFNKLVGINVGITMCRKKAENLPYYQS